MSQVQDEEVFEIVDFTSASEWEIFTSKLEEILLSWHLSLKDKEELTIVPVHINAGEWRSQSEDINFAGYPFIVSHHWTTGGGFIEDPNQKNDDTLSSHVNRGSQVFQALMDATSDFHLWTKCHPLSISYGLGDFVVISPAGNEMLTTESRINLVYSSISMAINNIQCRVPIFLQVHSKSQHLYQGAFEEKNLLVDFQMVHLKRIPPQCQHLSGLLEIFKEKIGSSSLDCVDVSVSWTFSVSGMTSIDAHENWPQSPPSLDNIEIVEIFPLGKLGFGATKDPIKEIQVSSIWQSLNEDVVVDSEVYTDLDPVQAPLWTVHLELNDQVGSMLIKTLCTILDYCRSAATTEQLLGKNYTVLQSPDSPEYEMALGALTKERGGYSLISSKRFFSGSKPTKTGGPIPEKTLVVLLNFLFPDAEGDVSKQTHPYPEEFPSDFPTVADGSSWKDLFQSLKSCPVESLVWRLAMVVVYAVAHLNGLESLAHLWHEIVLEFRYRWENGYSIPGLEPGTPDLNYSLLYQKLQMLNCCINHKKNIETGPPPDTTSGEEDEFFDATETAVEEEVPSMQHSAWNQPQGRKERTKMKLLRSDEFLYSPITQEGCPMTEDMIIEMTEMMEQLGQDAEGSELRARILSASLLSDMESFKAANPGAEIEDFVRWHSPRDWIEEESLTPSDGTKTESGHLSARMRGPGNLWQEMWNVAKPITAFRQKKLFDSTKEAEKILHSFSSMKVSQMLSILLPSIFHASVGRLLEELASTTLLDSLGSCRKIVSRTVQIFRNSPLDLYQYEDLLSSIQQVEVRVSQFNSLRCKMNSGSKDMDAFISNIMMDGNVSLPGGSHTEIGTILLRALEKSKGENMTSRLPPPIKKEFILRTKARRMGNGSTPSCQRMYCCIDQNSIRLAGAFTQDTMFY